MFPGRSETDLTAAKTLKERQRFNKWPKGARKYTGLQQMLINQSEFFIFLLKPKSAGYTNAPARILNTLRHAWLQEQMPSHAPPKCVCTATRAGLMVNRRPAAPAALSLSPGAK